MWSSASWGNAPSGSSMPTPPTYVLSGRGWSIAGEQNRASANVRKSPVYIGVDTVRDAPLRCVVSLHHLGPARPCPARSHPPERPPGPPAGRERGGAFSNRNGIPLTVPDVRRLLRLLNEPEEARRRVGLQWVQWRWQHQASARSGARRPARGAAALRRIHRPAAPDPAGRDRCAQRPPLAANRAALAAAETATGPSCCGAPAPARGPALGHAPRRPVARNAGTLRLLAYRLQPVSALV